MENSLLIVDGNDEYRQFLVDYFRKREFLSVGCATYEQAWVRSTEKRFDIAIVDYFIGKASGSALCEAITSRYQNRTALIITTDTQSTEIELSVRQHAPAFFFVKPFLVDNLYAVTLKILEARDKKELQKFKHTVMC